MPVSFSALAVTASLLVTVAASAADNVPKLDVTASCRGAAANVRDTKDAMDNCLRSEGRAHDLLVEQWQHFAATDRTKCVAAVSGFAPTYSELITCLEMARDAKNPPAPAAMNSRPPGNAVGRPRS